MTRYIFVETRDPFESRDTRFVEETATTLKERGHEVTVFLVQNGVLASRQAARAPYLDRLAQVGVAILADDFSLRERGIRPDELRPGVRPSGIEALVDALIEEGARAVWH
jgi:predicted peroxiredoxin